MTVGIYIRVSTEEQANEGYSISAQRERLKAFCTAQNWHDYKFYVDEGISGRDTKRPQLKKLMEDIRAGHIKVLLVYRLDRLTRSVRDLHRILDELEKYSCTFRSATEFYDTSTAMGKMFITIIAAIAEWESANLGERVSMGQVEKARQGEWLAQPPYGFYKDENDKLQINKEEIKAVKLMIKKIREGMSFRQLALYMDSSKYKPKRGYKWHIATLLSLLHNPALYGSMYWKDAIYENTHEGIMTKEEFEQLQKIISSRQNYKSRNVTSHFVYQTKIICPDCGSRCTSERTTWNRKTDKGVEVRNNYRCQVCALNHRDRSPFSTSEIKMDEALIEYMSNFTVMASKNENYNEDNNLSEIKNELKQIENQREKYQRAWANDLITDDEFKLRMDESRVRYESLQNELKNIEGAPQHPVDIERYKEITKSFNENYFRLNQEERRAFVQTFFESIKIEIIERSKGRGYRNQKIRIADISFY
ncbi:recombinase family protein [Lysinibacillus sp. KCTC 33748]|uniref:recombinase family protein n=1 Tax=unclassified Lysinibacillus TaxID=2636778 RepID=UPI0009A652B0|nr:MULTISPECIES: recombinase family protein [unclassified Lysinibacillus]OXS68744.1 recombinase family protein [Lysinibacillus sp. KCTC 33748]SKC08379.1 Site-specific DNA recombinase [Lysinibacillus sp. AC-3]